MNREQEEWNKRMEAAYRCREADRKKTMQHQPEKKGEPAAWLLVLMIDEVTERASPKCRVSSEGQSEVG